MFIDVFEKIDLFLGNKSLDRTKKDMKTPSSLTSD